MRLKKPIIILALGAVLVALAIDTSPPFTAVRVSWSYPPAELSTSLTFRVYSSTNVSQPLTNWIELTNVVGTNLSARIPVVPGQRYFFMTASNMWAESRPSAVVSTPALPRDDQNVTVSASP